MLALRSSSMSPSSPAGTPDTSLELQDDPGTKRRISSRMRSKPTTYSDVPERPPTSNGVKRKRAPTVDEQVENDNEEEVESESDEDGEPDEEELKEARRRTRTKAKKPATKKSKTATLAIRPAVNGVKRTARARKGKTGATGIAGDDETGLYGSYMSCLSCHRLT